MQRCSRGALAALAVLAHWSILSVNSHPLCLDETFPVKSTLAFCSFLSSNADGNCCTASEDAALKAKLTTALSGKTVSATCLSALTQVQCGSCHPWAMHLYSIGNVPTLSQAFCNSLAAACGSVTLVSLGIPARCGAPTDPYQYPNIPPPVPNTQGLAPGLARKWPMITLPGTLVEMKPQPNARNWWLLSKDGTLYTLPDNAVTSDQLQKVVDVSSRVVQDDNSEHGLVGLAMSPDFATSNEFYMTYIDGTTYKLSRFKYAAGNPSATLSSEVVVLSFTVGACCIHKAGWIGFQNNLLYWSIGDQGLFDPAQDPKSFYGKILRIDPFTRSGGMQYAIPTGNPYKGNTAGNKQEIFALGFRNPWRCSFGGGQLYCNMVGHSDVEGIFLVEAGTNAGWPNMENGWCRQGTCTGFATPIFSYCHGSVDVGKKCPSSSAPVTGLCITGGGLYQGPSTTATLTKGDYVFSDYASGHLVRLRKSGSTWIPSHLVPAGTAPRSSQLATDWEGNIYMVQYMAGVPGTSWVFSYIPPGAAPVPAPVPTPPAPTPPAPTPSTGTAGSYINCYKDNVASRAMTMQSGSVGTFTTPVAECTKRCRAAGYAYSGLEYYGECWCGNSYNKYGTLPASSCSTPCTAAKSTMCGGAGALSVYNSAAGPAPAPTPKAPTPKPPTPAPTRTPTLRAPTPPTPSGSCVAHYDKCGGIGYTGPTNCCAGLHCTKKSDYYYSCV